MTNQDWFDKDFYAELGVSKDASDAEIKKAYRALARKLHPDKNAGDAQAEKRFKEVGEAYSVLSDKEKRQQYDSIRAMAGGGARFTAGQGGSGGFEDLFGGMFGQGSARAGRGYSRSTGGQQMPPGYEDMLNSLFNGSGFSSTRGFEPGHDMQASTTLGFVAAARGETVTLEMPQGGSAQVRIPAGVKDGQKIRLRGRGHLSATGGAAGDLVVTVKVRPHPVFTRDDANNLRVTVPVSFDEAALGATIAVPTLEGPQVQVKVPAGTTSGRTMRVRHKGITTKTGTTDLLVTLQVAVPQRLDADARAAVEAYRAATAGIDPREDLMHAAKAAH